MGITIFFLAVLTACIAHTTTKTRTTLRRFERAIRSNLIHIERQLMNQAELIAQLQGDSAQIIKIGTETRSLLTKVEELLAQIANGEVTQEVADAAADVTTQLGIVDELVPDAPQP